MKSDHDSGSGGTPQFVRNIPDISNGCQLCGYIERGAEYLSDDHSHDFWQIIIVTSGRFSVSFDGDEHLLSAGWVHILPPGEKHILKSGSEGYSQIGIDIRADSDEGILLGKLFERPAVFRSSDAEWLGYTIRNNLRDSVEASEKVIACSVEALLHAITAECQRAAIDPVARKLSEWIDQHLSEKLTTSMISAGLFLSVPQLERICKKNYGCGIISLYNRRRFEKASAYLLSTRMTVGEIAELIGFDEVSNFSAFFSRHSGGISPMAYVRRGR